MREIKFRVWEKELGCFMPIQEWIKELKEAKFRTLGKEIVTKSSNIENLAVLLNQDIEIMQSTGLKDKNGKEIFRGDILGCKNLKFGIVKFEQGCYLCGADFLFNICNDYEVVGNIYEEGIIK